jgi:membrane-associated phospholipid phosphatase
VEGPMTAAAREREALGPARWGEDLGRRMSSPPALTALTVAIGGYALTVGVLLAAGLGLTHFVVPSRVGGWDADANAWLAHHRLGWLNQLTLLLSRSADTLGVLALAAVVIGVLVSVHRRWQAVALVVALALELLAFLAVNFVVDRPRPSVHKLGSTPTTSSFPSGHSAATVVVYLSVAIFVWIATTRWVPRALSATTAVVMPLAVAFARVYRGMHHPLDVTFGLAMGVAVTLAGIATVGAWHGARERESGSSEDPEAAWAQPLAAAS